MSASSPETIIESEGLSKFYRSIPALRNLSLQVRRGEVFGFLGPNGAGKTTFIKILLDFIRPSAGEIRILGQSPDRLDRKRIGYLPERISVHTFLTGREFLLYQAGLIGIPSAQARQEIQGLLERVRMAEDADRRVGGYSKGMIQRIGVAASLLGQPELLLWDEPVSGLDPIGISQIREVMISERSRGATIFVNSHQLLEVEKTCDRVAILNRGRVAAQGRREELSSQKGVALEVENMTEALAGDLRKLDPQAKIEGVRAELTLEGTDPETERLLPKRIVEQGARLVHYSQRRESLEDIFYRLVQDAPAGDE